MQTVNVVLSGQGMNLINDSQHKYPPAIQACVNVSQCVLVAQCVCLSVGVRSAS